MKEVKEGVGNTSKGGYGVSKLESAIMPLAGYYYYCCCYCHDLPLVRRHSAVDERATPQQRQCQHAQQPRVRWLQGCIQNTVVAQHNIFACARPFSCSPLLFSPASPIPRAFSRISLPDMTHLKTITRHLLHEDARVTLRIEWWWWRRQQ